MAQDNSTKVGTAWALFAYALLASCSLIVDSKLENTAQDGAPGRDLQGRDGGHPLADLMEPPPPPDVRVDLQLYTAVVWPGDEIAYAVIIDGAFKLAGEKIGHAPMAGEGHYVLLLRGEIPPSGEMLLYRGAEQEHSIPFKGTTDEGLPLPPGVYQLVVKLVYSNGEPIPGIPEGVADLEVCGFDYGSALCDPAPPRPPPPEMCAPQDSGCTPTCFGSRTCDACVYPSCLTGHPCVKITRLDPVAIPESGTFEIDLAVTAFRIYDPLNGPPTPYERDQGYILIGVGDASTFWNIVDLGATSAKITLGPQIVAEPEGYLLRAKLLTFDGIPLDPPAEACWPISVGVGTKP